MSTAKGPATRQERKGDKPPAPSGDDLPGIPGEAQIAEAVGLLAPDDERAFRRAASF